MTKDYLCRWRGCNQLAEYESSLNNSKTCPKHMKMMSLKFPKAKFVKIKLDPMLKKLINNYKYNKFVDVAIKNNKFLLSEKEVLQ